MRSRPSQRRRLLVGPVALQGLRRLGQGDVVGRRGRRGFLLARPEVEGEPAAERRGQALTRAGKLTKRRWDEASVSVRDVYSAIKMCSLILKRLTDEK